MDGEGRVYEQPITHVAVTPNPLVPDLEGWQKIAASLKTSDKGKETGMWKKIAKALGLDTKDMTEENAEASILSGILSNGSSSHAAPFATASRGIP